MSHDQSCSRCGSQMKRIPIKRLDDLIMIEFYCDKCDESITFYPELDKIEKESGNFF